MGKKMTKTLQKKLIALLVTLEQTQPLELIQLTLQKQKNLKI